MRKLVQNVRDTIKKYKRNNPHKYDEMPKNKASRLITTNCEDYKWLQEPGSYGGHKIRKNGHRIVSGIVRAKEKEKIREMIDKNIDSME